MKNLNHLIYIILMLFFTVSCENNEILPKEEDNVIGNFSSMQDGLITLKSGAVVEKKGVHRNKTRIILARETIIMHND